jgi:hypothetical protein
MLSEGNNLYLVGHDTLGRWDGDEWAYHLPDALGSVRQGMGLLPVVALAIFLVALRYYPLGKEQVLALRQTLDVRHRQKAELPTTRGGQEQ